MLSLLVLHWHVLNRDNNFYRRLLIFVLCLLSAMLVLTGHLQQQDQPLVNGGNVLYRGLTVIAFVLLIALQPYSRALGIVHIGPYGPWESVLHSLLTSVLEASIPMLVCLPLYALTTHTGGIQPQMLLEAGCLLLASVVLATSIQLNEQTGSQRAITTAQVVLALLALAPYLLAQISYLPEPLIAVLRSLSVPQVLTMHFAGGAGFRWLVTSLFYLVMAMAFVVRAGWSLHVSEIPVGIGISEN